MARKNETKKTTAQYGSVTLPAESGQEKVVLDLVRRWGADAIRDSDGTQLSPELLELDRDIYSTICLVRADQQYPREHPEHIPQKFLMSAPVTAASSEVTIDPMSAYFRQKYEINKKADPKKWWEVIDRTSGEVVDPANWEFDTETRKVTIRNAQPFHVYTVNFLVHQIWDSTSMYNHLVNNWTKPHVICTEPYPPEARKHLMEYFDKWLAEHPDTRVVRLTTLAYHFTLDSDPTGADKYRDWLGYLDTITTEALEDFAREKGYRLRSEDFVDEGYYNATYRVPSPKYLDWMAFVQRFVIGFGKELVDKIHAAGKKAGIFWGDHWIGAEFYSPGFQEIGIDVNIGAVEGGVALRRLSDTPGPQTKEARFYPYFFPDVFHPGGNPLSESIANWTRIRRALHRKMVDRIGYGGYLSLAARFPKFIEHVTTICNEFREIQEQTRKTPSWKAPIKVAVLNAWGKLRSWQENTSKAEKFHVKRPDIIELGGSNLLECLSGLPVEVQFLSFAEVERDGIPRDFSVIINDGDAGSAWSGGRHWANPKVAAAVRAFIHRGGGFLGVQEPAAFQHQGRFFQLADVMGVEKETGNSNLSAPVRFQVVKGHFVRDDKFTALDFCADKNYVFCHDPKTQVLWADKTGRHVHLAANRFGKGRSLYMAGLPYSLKNSRLLLRALFWLARKESALKKWFCENLNMECAAYPKRRRYVVFNNTGEKQSTVLYDGKGNKSRVTLKPYESKWFSMG